LPRARQSETALLIHSGQCFNDRYWLMLFKYLRPERIDVLDRLELRFTQPGALNDPFELRPRFDSLVAEADILPHLSAMPVDFSLIPRQAYEILPKEQ
jgi:hypothetical protein